MTLSYYETHIPNSEMIVFSTNRLFPADVFIPEHHNDVFVVIADYVGVGFEVMMSNN